MCSTDRTRFTSSCALSSVIPFFFFNFYLLQLPLNRLTLLKIGREHIKSPGISWQTCLPLPSFNLSSKKTTYITCKGSSLCLENSFLLISTCWNSLILYETVKNVSQVLNGVIINGGISVFQIRTKTRVFTIITLIQCCILEILVSFCSWWLNRKQVRQGLCPQSANKMTSENVKCLQAQQKGVNRLRRDMSRVQVGHSLSQSVSERWH